jgi:IS5 family transposase
LFFAPEILEEWKALSKKKKIVGEPTYPDSVIQCCHLLRLNYRLCLRQSTGFIKSLFVLLGMSGLLVPDYSTLCRRQKILPVEIGQRLERGENLVVGIDSTGLKVYGEGEWKVRKHGWTKHRTWRKLHICIDINTQEILDAELTTNGEDDASVGQQMLAGKTANISTFHGDGAYDDIEFRKFLGEKIDPIIPPPKNAIIRKSKKNEPLPPHLIKRNESVEYIENHGSKAWKIAHGYHKRSLNETVMFRFKKIFGGELAARTMENQKSEILLKCLILNKFTGIGMPDSYKVA